MVLKPHSKGECRRLVIQTTPPKDHEYGWYGKTAEKWAAKFGINKKKFWKVFGVNTCMIDDSNNKVVYYECDIERTIRECINRKWVSGYEWD